VPRNTPTSIYVSSAGGRKKRNVFLAIFSPKGKTTKCSPDAKLMQAGSSQGFERFSRKLYTNGISAFVYPVLRILRQGIKPAEDGSGRTFSCNYGGTSASMNLSRRSSPGS